MRRVMVLGHSGSGKTTMALVLSAVLAAPFVDIAKIRHDEAWAIRPEAEFRALLDAATDAERWVTDHNGADMRGLVWPKADTALLLDYPQWFVVWRLTRRTFRRGILREDFRGNGVREGFWRHVLPSRRSKLYRAVANFRERRETLLAHLREPAYAHLRVITFTSPRQADDWVRALRSGASIQSVDSR
jgi:adenylate kinase family enzyme